MKGNIIKVSAVVIIMMSLIGGVAKADDSDFTEFNEVDAGNNITIVEDEIYFEDITRSQASYVYEDYGLDYFSGSYTINATIEIDNASDNGFNYIGFFGVSNGLGDMKVLYDGNYELQTVWLTKTVGGDYELTLYDLKDKAQVLDNSVPLSAGTNYYLTMTRDENVGTYGMLYLYIYSDSERSVLVDTLTVTLTAKTDMRYLYGFIGNNAGDAYTCEGYTKDMSWVVAVEPEVSLVSSSSWYEPMFEYFSANVTANVTNDGGASVLAGIYYKESAESEWLIANASGTFVSGETFTVNLFDLDAATTYDYYAWVYNDAGYGYTSTSNFTTSYQTGVPEIATLMYPIDTNSSNQSATVYGYMYYDGTDNCTAWFWYRQVDQAWVQTATQSPINTGDTWYINISGLTVGKTYQFRASANNTYGSVNGSIGSFVIADLELPEVDTLVCSSYTDTTATLSANLTEDGGESCLTWIEYRKFGDDAWLSTQVGFTSTDDSDNWSTQFNGYVHGLTPSTTYEYKAVATNSAGEAEGETLTFRTYEQISVPVLDTESATWLNDSSTSVLGTVDHDGGSGVEVWFQYREKGVLAWIDNDDYMVSQGIETGYSVEHLIIGLNDGTTYEYRMVGLNEIGYGYGDVIEMTQTDPSNPINVMYTGGWADWLATRVLAQVGLNNTGGKMLFVVLMCLIVFGLFFKSVIIRTAMVCIVLTAFTVSGWVMSGVLVAIVFGAGLGLYWVTKKITANA